LPQPAGLGKPERLCENVILTAALGSVSCGHDRYA
jgi:hypothetical protein